MNHPIQVHDGFADFLHQAQPIVRMTHQDVAASEALTQSCILIHYADLQFHIGITSTLVSSFPALARAHTSCQPQPRILGHLSYITEMKKAPLGFDPVYITYLNAYVLSPCSQKQTGMFSLQLTAFQTFLQKLKKLSFPSRLLIISPPTRSSIIADWERIEYLLVRELDHTFKVLVPHEPRAW